MTQTLTSEDWTGLRPQQGSYVSGLPLKHSHSGTSRGMPRGPVHGNQQQARSGESGFGELCLLRLSVCSKRIKSQRSHSQQLPCLTYG